MSLRERGVRDFNGFRIYNIIQDIDSSMFLNSFEPPITMSHREEKRKMKTLDRTELQIEELIRTMREAEEFLKRTSVSTEKRRDKENVILNCLYLLNPLKRLRDQRISEALKGLEGL
jgi:hypothetical protein